MSRVGKRILKLPAGLIFKQDERNCIEVVGKLGKLSFCFSPKIIIDHNLELNEIKFSRKDELKQTKQLHGTTASLLQNMIEGVSQGFKKFLEIKGVGYRAALKGNNLEIVAGYSHPVLLEIPQNLKVEVPKPVEIVVSGIDKAAVSHFAAVIRKVRKPSPYSGKGIMYKDEQVRRKEGKKASK